MTSAEQEQVETGERPRSAWVRRAVGTLALAAVMTGSLGGLVSHENAAEMDHADTEQVLAVTASAPGGIDLEAGTATLPMHTESGGQHDHEPHTHSEPEDPTALPEALHANETSQEPL